MIIIAGGSGHLGTKIMQHLVDKNEYDILNLSSKLCLQLLNQIEQVELDLTNYDELIQSTAECTNRVHAIINLAGRSKRKKSNDFALPDFEHLTNDFLHDFRILFNLSRLMLENSNLFVKGAKLIDVGSLWASHIPFSDTYLDLGNEPDLSVLLSKTSKRVFIKYLARELSKQGYTANQLTPGWFPKPSNTPRLDYINGIVSRIPAGRIGIPSDLFPALDMLISKESTYINGQEIVVDGGFSIY